MAWAGVDLIPVRDGETPRQAVDRVYAGGPLIRWDDSNVWTETIPGGEKDVGLVSQNERAWMLHSVEVLRDLMPDGAVTDELKEPGRRWPWSMTFSAASTAMFVDIGTDHLTLKLMRPYQPTDDDWLLWWRTIQAFAKEGCVAFEPDESEIVATSLSATVARERYRWF